MKPFYGFSKSLLLELLISAIPLLFENVSSENKFEPKVVLYENLGGRGGSSFKSVAKNYPNLNSVNFNDKAQTACLVGTWLFYGDENYANYNHGVSAQFRSDGTCLNFQKLNKSISSFRFAGSAKDFRADVLDLFNGILFTDIHLRTHSDIANVTEIGFPDTASAIVHGKSKWTLFENTDFRGRSVCVSPQSEFTPAFYKSQLELGIGNNNVPSVLSVRKGCQSSGSSNIEVAITTTAAYEIIHGENKITQRPKPGVSATNKPNRPIINKPNNHPSNRPRPNRPTNKPNVNHPHQTHPHQTHPHQQ